MAWQLGCLHLKSNTVYIYSLKTHFKERVNLRIVFKNVLRLTGMITVRGLQK